jgi:hypothetical protein
MYPTLKQTHMPGWILEAQNLWLLELFGSITTLGLEQQGKYNFEEPTEFLC